MGKKTKEPGELWQPIEGFANYEVSNMGNIRNKKKGNVLKLSKHQDKGYHICFLYQSGKSKVKVVHRLVAKAFLPNPNGKPNVMHKNHNKLDNRVENLKWATHEECVANSPKSRGNAALSLEEEQDVKNRLLKGETGASLALEYQTSEMTISRIRKKYNIPRKVY